MKTTKASLLIAAILLAPFTFAERDTGGSSVPDGNPGVMEGDCWENSVGDDTIEFTDIHGTTMGNMWTEITDQDGNSGHITNGTPDPDGGVADTPGIDTDSDGTLDYRVHNGDAQTKNAAGEWVDMHKVDCPEDDDNDVDRVSPSTATGGTSQPPPPPPG